MTELRRQDRWASVFFTLKDPGGRRLPRRADAARAVRRAAARTSPTASACTSSDGRAVRAARRVPAEGADDRALRPRRPPRRARAAEGEAGGRGALRLVAQAAPAALPAADRARHGQRRRRQARRADAHRRAFRRPTSLVAETYVQGPRAAPAIATAIGDLCPRGADVIVLARGGGSFEDLLPFSDERVVRAVAECPVPVVSRGRARAGHAALRPGGGRARVDADRAGRLVVPDIEELRAHLERAHAGSHRGARRAASVTRSGSPRRTSGSAARRCSRWSASARGSTRCTHGSARSRRSRPSSAATRSSAAPRMSSATAAAGRDRGRARRSRRRRHLRSDGAE